ncbi:MAG TPA: lytic transglycosylase domain-containing protein [Melioribacteraceae bacterium]|nr:lytic transglycosylase domain-containing protein [Melioribacteraceae bacterium]
MDRKLVYVIGSLIVFVIISGIIIIQKISSLEKETPREVIVHMEKDHRELIPSIPDKMDFCGEAVPFQDFDVLERMERELLVNAHWSSSTILNIKRANRWFPVIEPILKRYGIPDDFKYLAVIESNLTNVVSPAGAAGFWQLMAPVAKEYGLEVNDKIDERFNIEKATVAACRYLEKAFNKYGNWTMAAASYNFGMNGIDKQIGRQKSRNYYNLYLVEETNRFVFRLLAIKEILSNPGKYGFFIEEDQLYKPIATKEVIVKREIKDLAGFASAQGINYKILKIFNPWLRDNHLPNRSGKAYSVLIPLESEIELIEE